MIMKIKNSKALSSFPKSVVGRKGFTLIELVVSMSVTLAIIGVLTAMTKVAVDGMQSSQSATRFSRLSQEVLTTISRDMEGIVLRNTKDVEWLRVQENSNSSSELGPGNDKNIMNPIEMSFFSAVTDRYDGGAGTDADGGGDISLVRYKLVYQDVITGSSSGSGDNFPVFSLYRNRVNPDVTFTEHLGKEEIESFSASVTGDDFLAENIYDMTISFNFEFISDEGFTIHRRIPIQVNGAATSLSINGEGVEVNGEALVLEGASEPRLVSADLSLLVLSDLGMNGLENVNIGSAQQLSEYLAANGKNYSKSLMLSRP